MSKTQQRFCVAMFFGGWINLLSLHDGVVTDFFSGWC
jgi:hypothetical protein